MKPAHANPVWQGYLADPFVWRHAGVYYAVGTGAAEAGGRPARGVFPLLRSDDLFTWTPLGEALQRPDPALGDSFWAPEVAFDAGRFHLYYSVGHGEKGHHLRVAVSERPEGPFVDTGTPLIDRSEMPFSIDPHAFRDDDGRWYLFYARDFLDFSDAGRVGTSLEVDRLVTMTRLAREPRTVLRARHDWQRYERDRPMYGATYDWHTLEGPCVRRRDGRYYCFFSGGRWENDTYGVDYATADSVLGPYTSDGDAGPRVLRTAGGVIGPGHNSLVVGPDGADYLVYHAWDEAFTARRMCVDRLDWTPDGPRCTATRAGAGPGSASAAAR